MPLETVIKLPRSLRLAAGGVGTRPWRLTKAEDGLRENHAQYVFQSNQGTIWNASWSLSINLVYYQKLGLNAGDPFPLIRIRLNTRTSIKMFSPAPFEERHADPLKELIANPERNSENLVLTNNNLWGKNAFPNARLRF